MDTSKLTMSSLTPASTSLDLRQQLEEMERRFVSHVLDAHQKSLAQFRKGIRGLMKPHILD
jgi:hypothetical protein